MCVLVLFPYFCLMLIGVPSVWPTTFEIHLRMFSLFSALPVPGSCYAFMLCFIVCSQFCFLSWSYLFGVSPLLVLLFV